MKLYSKKDEKVAHLYIEAIFPKKYKMNKIVKCIYTCQEKLKWDPNLLHSQFIPIKEGNKAFGFTYSLTKK